MDFTLSKHEGNAVITVYIDGEDAKIAGADHPNFRAIMAAALEDSSTDAEILELFDAPSSITSRFKRLTERFSVRDSKIYLDGDEIHNALTTQIIRFMDEGLDFGPLVAFAEKIQTNPNKQCREAAYTWLNACDFTLTETGDIVGYKGCSRNADGILVSTRSGPAIVNGEDHISGPVPQPIGGIIEMARGQVRHDPSAPCSVGLHVGTFKFAGGYTSGGAMLEVHVNPRDIVSVPTEGEKMRVCRYKIIGEVTEQIKSALRKEAKETKHTLVVQPTEAEKVVDPEVPKARVKRPTEDQFTVMQQRAKRRRRNFEAYATKMGPWTLTGDDANNRKHWEVTA